MKFVDNFVKQEEEKDAVESLIRQAIGKEPFLSFSRAADGPFQLIQLLNSFDKQGSGKICRSEENYIELKENSLDRTIGCNQILSKEDGIIEPINFLKGCGEFTKGSKITSTMQPFKIPEGVVEFAQAAAKANGDLKITSKVSRSDICGWPLISPSKRQLHKCDKCSREFCSSINYRRHIRVHRRSLNVHRDSPKNRHILSEFWDKLSIDGAKELVSLKRATVEEISGSSVIKALSTWIWRPSILSSLSQIYIKAGLTLLDVVQACPSVFPISSHELFSVLDDASENTFLCAGTAVSVQKYVFDGESVKNALEIKNLVALTSFFIEKELVIAWLAEKDAEALRCHKLLLVEEEFALKRQAKILERKRLKKLRQKDQKAKENTSVMNIDFKNPLSEFPDCAHSTESCSSLTPSGDFTSEASLNQEQHFFHPSAFSGDDEDANLKLSLHEREFDKNKSPRFLFHPEHTDHQTQWVNVHSKPVKNFLNGFRSGHFVVAKSSPLRQSNRDLKSVSGKVWTKKLRPDSEEGGNIGRVSVESGPIDQGITSDTNEVLIGSINVTLKTDVKKNQYTVLRSHFQEKTDSSLISANNGAAVKLWRPVSRHGNDNSVQNDRKIDVFTCQAYVMNSTDQSCLTFRGPADVDCEKYSTPMLFSCEVLRSFLAQRWKEAIAGEHVVVVSSSETEASECSEALETYFAKATAPTGHSRKG